MLTEEHRTRVWKEITETERLLAKESSYSPDLRDQQRVDLRDQLRVDILNAHLEMLRGLLK